MQSILATDSDLLLPEPTDVTLVPIGYKYSTDENNPPAWVKNASTALFPLWVRLIPLFKYLANDKVNELVINRPCEVLVEYGAKWETYHEPALDYDWLVNIARLVANYSNQTITEQEPVLSSTLPTGERVQICAFSAVLTGYISFTIRKPSNITITLEEYIESGYFDNTEWVSDVDINEIINSRLITPGEKYLALALHEKRWNDFFTASIEHRQNILLSGATGSGKTTFMKALVMKVPGAERLLSIENVDELGLYKTHKNTVPLFYSAGGQGVSNIKQGDLLVCSLRMRPDRIFCAELLTGNDAFYYLRNIGSGHPGSISTMHGTTAFGAKEQLVVFIKESDAGNSLTKQDIMDFLDKSVNMIFQVNKINHKRQMTQIDYDPLRPYRKREDSVTKALNNIFGQLQKQTELLESTIKNQTAMLEYLLKSAK